MKFVYQNTSIFVVINAFSAKDDGIVGQDACPDHGIDVVIIVVGVLDTVYCEVMFGNAAVFYIQALFHQLSANVELIVSKDAVGF